MNLFILKEPFKCEPICSGIELRLDIDQTLVLRHYHASIIISFGLSKPCRYFRTRELTLACELKVDGKSLVKDKFWTGKDTIGMTLFCAGFPCLTVTGHEDDSVIVTLSEIVRMAPAD